MTTIEEMVETFMYAEFARGGFDHLRPAFRSGLLAVIEKHIGPMLAKAYEMALLDCDVPFDKELDGTKATARILAQLKGTP